MEPSQVTPTFRGELYFLIAKFLEDGPCREAAQKLRQEITANDLVPARYDWTGASHPKTFRDMEEEFGTIAPEFLVQRCFELCTATADPTAPPVRSLFSRAFSSSSNAAKNKPLLTRPAKVGNFLQNVQKLTLGFNTPGRIWHEKYLCRQLKYLRRTLGHLSAVYCLTFDRTGQVVRKSYSLCHALTVHIVKDEVKLVIRRYLSLLFLKGQWVLCWVFPPRWMFF